MKNLIAALMIALSSFGLAQTIPAVPSATFSASPTRAQVGTHPTLTWEILFPSNVGTTAIIAPPASIILIEPTYVSARVLGVESTERNGVEASIAVDSNVYQQLFYGVSSAATPQYSAYIKKHEKNTVINVGFRAVANNQWGEFYSSKTPNVRAFKNGDVLPMASYATVESFAPFVKPYVDAGGRARLGPMDVLILADFGSGPRPMFKDAGMIITFSSKHPNNGHGNNLDGVDPSNPSMGMGGPNGLKNTGTYEDIELK